MAAIVPVARLLEADSSVSLESEKEEARMRNSASPIREEIARLNGPDRSQQFESLIATIAQSQWPQMRLTRGNGPNLGGGPDWILTDLRTEAVRVLIEAKAYSTPEALDSAKLRAQFDRFQAAKRGNRRPKRILATPVSVPKELQRRLLKVVDVIWDLDELVRIVSRNGFLAAILGLIENRDEVLGSNLPVMRSRGALYAGIRIESIAEESLSAREKEDIRKFETGRTVCVHGAPYTGKSCWAIRQAFRFLRDREDRVDGTVGEFPTAYILNAGVYADTLPEVVALLPSLKNSLVILDDVHHLSISARNQLAAVIARTAAKKSGTRYILVSRDADSLNLFEGGNGGSLLLDLARVPRMVYARLRRSSSPWKAVTAVLSGSLTPALAD